MATKQKKKKFDVDSTQPALIIISICISFGQPPTSKLIPLVSIQEPRNEVAQICIILWNLRGRYMQTPMKIMQLSMRTTQVPVKVIRNAYTSMLRRRALQKHKNKMPFQCEIYEPMRQPDTSPDTKMIIMRKITPPEGPSVILSSKNPLIDKQQDVALNMKSDEKSFSTLVKCLRPNISMQAPRAIIAQAMIQGHLSMKIVNAGMESAGQPVSSKIFTQQLQSLPF